VSICGVPEGAEQAVGVGGYGRRRRPGWAVVNEGSYFLPYCEAVMADLRIRMCSILSSSWTYYNLTSPDRIMKVT